MTNMFKRSLIAMAIAGVSTGAMAADVTPTDTTYATDQFMTTMAEILSKNVALTLNDEYREGDEIYLRLEGDAYISGAPVTVDINPDLGNLKKGFTLDFRGQFTEGGDTILIYRLSELVNADPLNPTADTTIGVTVDFGRFNFDAPTVVAQDGVLFSTFSRPVDDIWVPNTALGAPVYQFDEVMAPMIDETQLFKMGEQYEIRVETPYEGEIDVWDYRRQFRTDGGSHGDLYSTNEGEFWVVTTENPDANTPADDNGNGEWDFVVNEDLNQDWQVRYTLSGSNMFGWIANDPIQAEAVFSQGNINNCVYVSHTANEFVFDCDETDVPVNLEFDLLGGVDSEQNPKQDGDFMLSATVNWENTDGQYTDAGQVDNIDFPEDGVLGDTTNGSTDLGPVEAGAWGVNGSITHIPYMPYSAQSEAGAVTPISQIIYVTNIYRDPGFDDASDGGLYPDDVGEGETPENNNVNRIIWVDAVREDGTNFRCENSDLNGKLANYGVTQIAGEIRSCLFDQGALDSSAKFSLTVNVADYPTNISIYSAYNVNGSDRGWVQNDSVRTDYDVYDLNEQID